MNSTQVPQNEKQEQPAKEGQKLFSFPLIKNKSPSLEEKALKETEADRTCRGEHQFAKDATPSLKILPHSHSSPEASKDNSCPH